MRLLVKDTGIGIAVEDQERVFERFERGAGQGRQAGAGLGLALVKSLVNLHGGTVAIESARGAGTTVICNLPKAATFPPATRASAGPEAGDRAASRTD